MARMLVTGCGGFIGKAFAGRLSEAGHVVRRIVRNHGDAESVAVSDMADYNGWAPLLEGVDVVVHLAARAHILRKSERNSLREFSRTNVDATLKLARAAVQAGVPRFVFLSSIGVNGNCTTGLAFSEGDVPVPTEPYAISKWQAECGLVQISEQTGIELVRIRTPLVIGSGVKGNLRRLMGLVDSGVPMPFGAVRNRRNYIALDDVCGFLAVCAVDRRIRNELFLIANDEEISTPELIKQIAEGLGRHPRLWSAPMPLVYLAARLFGVEAPIRRMTTSLCVSSQYALSKLGWAATCDIREGIELMVRSYRKR